MPDLTTTTHAVYIAKHWLDEVKVALEANPGSKHGRGEYECECGRLFAYSKNRETHRFRCALGKKMDKPKKAKLT